MKLAKLIKQISPTVNKGFGKKAELTTLYIPNNEEGRGFIKQLRSFCNYNHWNIRVRGRGERQNAHQEAQAVGKWQAGWIQASIPQEFAEYFAVYISPKGSTGSIVHKKHLDEYRKRYWELEASKKEVEAAKAENATLKAEIAKLKLDAKQPIIMQVQPTENKVVAKFEITITQV